MKHTRLLAALGLLLSCGTLLAAAVHRRPAHAARLARSGLRVPMGMAEKAGVVPGRETTDLDHLHPTFRAKVARITARLGAEGHTVRVAAVYRSPARQDLIFHFSRAMERLGASPGTKVRGGQSCHNQTVDGAPASAAIDIRGGKGLRRAEQADFYKALGRAAAVEGLRWGGSWQQRNPTWARYDLGWDPGHVEDAGLCRRLRRG